MYYNILIVYLYLLILFPQGSIPLIDVRYKEIGLALILGYFLFKLLLDKKVFRVSMKVLTLLIVWTTFVILMAFNGLINGNDTSYIISEMSSLLLIWLIYPFMYIKKLTTNNNILLKHLIISTGIVSLLYLLIIFVTFVGIINDWQTINDFLVNYGLGSFLPNNNFYRLFLKANFFIMVAVILSIYLYVNNRKLIYLFHIIPGLLVTFLSGTRGLMIPILLFLIMYIFLTKRKNILGLLPIFMFIFLLIVPNIIMFTNLEESPSFRSINPFFEDGGNSIKAIQTEYIWGEIQESFILGNGLGVTYEEINRTNSVEVVYMDILNKFGIIGFILFLLLIYVVPLLLAIKQGRNTKEIQALIFFLLGLSITLGTNPYILSSLGMLIIILLYCTFMSPNKVRRGL